MIGAAVVTALLPLVEAAASVDAADAVCHDLIRIQ